jgi:hypothetical protein
MKKAILRYGPDRAQVAEVWRPGGEDRAQPVVALIHGGFWRQIYTKRLMHRMAEAVVAHGWVAYNIEYRRVGAFGRGGWPRPAAGGDVWTLCRRPVGPLGGVIPDNGSSVSAAAVCAGIRGGVPCWRGRSRSRRPEHGRERSGHRIHGRKPRRGAGSLCIGFPRIAPPSGHAPIPSARLGGLDGAGVAQRRLCRIGSIPRRPGRVRAPAG